MKSANERYLGQIRDIVKHMNGNKKEIYNFFDRKNFKDAFYARKIIECLDKEDIKLVPPADKIDEKIKQNFKDVLLKIEYNPTENSISETKGENEGENENDELNGFQLLKDENYRLYKFYHNLAGEYKDKIRKEIFDMFKIQPTSESKKNRDVEMAEYIDKFNCACNGEGEELRKISFLTSSSLCAFLCFYKVSEDNPLYLKIDKKYAKFTESIFEWKNPLFGKWASSIDVVLVGTYVDNPRKKVVYFVESKFSEYYYTSNTYLIPICYIVDKDWKRLYKNKNLAGLNLKLIRNTVYKDGKKKTEFRICALSKQTEQYLGGVQQMFRHYIGVNNLLYGKKEHNFGKYIDLEGAEVYLGTIIFKMQNGTQSTEAYDNYQKLNTEVASHLTKDLDDNYGPKEKRKFKTVLYPKIYQNIFSSKYKYGPENLKNLTKEIKDYYNFE